MTRKATLALSAALIVGLTFVNSAAEATGPRVPQVPVQPTKLQDYFNSVGQTIDAYNDQVDIQCWSTTVSNNATFTLQVELTAGLAPQNAFGIYNCGDGPSPALNQVFPGGAEAGWFAVASFFANGNLVINLFDETATLQGSTTYTGVNRSNFGFYLQNELGTFYSQDSRNGGFAQALTYAGTGTSSGQWWLAWEDLPYLEGDLDFEDMIVFLESVNKPVPAVNTTWGSIKSRY
jgi:hypothetical protein